MRIWTLTVLTDAIAPEYRAVHDIEWHSIFIEYMNG